MDIVLIVGQELSLLNAPKAILYFPEAYTHPVKVWQKVKSLIQLAEQSPNADLPFRIVTHSEALLNRFGEGISNGEAYHVMVELHEGDGHTVMCPFDSEGYLMEPWPYGFFHG